MQDDALKIERLLAAFEDGLFDRSRAVIVNGRLLGPCMGGGRRRSDPKAMEAYG